MANPWLKKNPFLSMWLSGANSVANRARGQITATAKRQQASALRQGSRVLTDAWFNAFKPKRRS